MLIYPQPNRNAYALRQGAADIKDALDQRRRRQSYEEEIARAMQDQQRDLDRQAILDQQRQTVQAQQMGEATQMQGERQAEQEYNASQVPGPRGLAGATNPAHAARMLRMKDLVGRMSPEAGRMALQDFAQQEQVRLVGEAVTKTRRKIQNAIKGGALGEEQAGLLLQDLTPQLAQQDPGAALKVMGEVESYIEQANRNLAEQEADDLTWAQADMGLQEAWVNATPLAKAGVLPPEKMRAAAVDYGMLRRQWGDLTPMQQSERVQGLMKALMPQPQKPRGPASGENEGGFTSPFLPPGGTQGGEMSPAELHRMNAQPEPAQPQAQAAPPAAPSSAEPRQAAPQAAPKIKTRTAYLGGDRGPEEAPERMRAEVARLLLQGVPEAQASKRLGLRLGTLTAADWDAIEHLVKELRGGTVR